jgi:hypothetical protein
LKKINMEPAEFNAAGGFLKHFAALTFMWKRWFWHLQRAVLVLLADRQLQLALRVIAEGRMHGTKKQTHGRMDGRMDGRTEQQTRQAAGSRWPSPAALLRGTQLCFAPGVALVECLLTST